MAKPAAYFGCQWLLGQYLYAIIRMRFAIRTYNTDSGPSPWPSPEGEGMVRANSKPGCQTKSEAHICSLLPSREKGGG
jgi:hypothetical protein